MRTCLRSSRSILCRLRPLSVSSDLARQNKCWLDVVDFQLLVADREDEVARDEERVAEGSDRGGGLVLRVRAGELRPVGVVVEIECAHRRWLELASEGNTAGLRAGGHLGTVVSDGDVGVEGTYRLFFYL